MNDQPPKPTDTGLELLNDSELLALMTRIKTAMGRRAMNEPAVEALDRDATVALPTEAADDAARVVERAVRLAKAQQSQSVRARSKVLKELDGRPLVSANELAKAISRSENLEPTLVHQAISVLVRGGKVTFANTGQKKD